MLKEGQTEEGEEIPKGSHGPGLRLKVTSVGLRHYGPCFLERGVSGLLVDRGAGTSLIRTTQKLLVTEKCRTEDGAKRVERKWRQWGSDQVLLAGGL